jgi:hypothetical protein
MGSVFSKIRQKLGIQSLKNRRNGLRQRLIAPRRRNTINNNNNNLNESQQRRRSTTNNRSSRSVRAVSGEPGPASRSPSVSSTQPSSNRRLSVSSIQPSSNRRPSVSSTQPSSNRRQNESQPPQQPPQQQQQQQQRQQQQQQQQRQQQEQQKREQLLERIIYENFFKKTKNIKQIHQRHATTCANVLNKGLEATAKLPTGAPSIWDIKELAPNTSLTGIGIQQCMQVSDFLLSCKSKNVNYITSQNYSSIEDYNSQSQPEQPEQPRPMLIFCCSELLRTQQTLFISYFDIIKDYLKTGRKIIVLFWLNELHFAKSINADNFVVSLAHTKIQWKYFINRIKNLESDKNFMEDIGREKIEEFSEKLKLETTGTLNYEEWEDIFYVSPIVYFNNPLLPRLLGDFSFDNRRFSSGGRKFLVGKEMYDPKEMYKVLPRILAEYISKVGIIGRNKGVGFYEEELSQDVKMNLVFVSHHNSCENALKYLTGGQSKQNVFNKQQLMNAEIVILPKSGILWSQEYSAVFTDNDFKVDNIETVNIVRNELTKIDRNQTNDKNVKNAIKIYFTKPTSSNDTFIKILEASKRTANDLRAILYLKYLIKQEPQQPQQELDFSLKNRIFPVGFYDMIVNLTIKRKNKTNQLRHIYPLFILYNSQLGIFFTPPDVVKQEIAIIPILDKKPGPVAQNFPVQPQLQQAGLGIPSFLKKAKQPRQLQQGEIPGIETSSEIFSLSSPFRKFLDMSLEDYSNFLETSNQILKGISDMYNPKDSPQPEGVASEAVEGPKRNTYFYDYDKLSKNIEGIITRKINPYKNKLPTQQPPPTLLQYLRNNFDTKTLVHYFGNCLFDFCAIIEPAKNRLRQIVREKLKLEVGEKNYADSFNQEVARRLMKFMVDYEKERGEIKNTNANAKIIPTYNEIPYSKKEILKDSDKLSYDNTINAEVIKIYSKYLIIDVFAESKILKLIEERNRKETATNGTATNGTATNRKTRINTEISRILQPFQKKFMGMLMHKNIRNNGELNVSTQIHREVSNRAITGKPLNPFVPMTVSGNRNVLDEIIAFYKAEKVGEYKVRIIAQIKRDYEHRIKIFNYINDNYVINNKINYNSYWKIMAEDYGNLNIEYQQSCVFLIYVSLFYKYDKLAFFKNIYLVNSLFHEKFTSYGFMKFILRTTTAQEMDPEYNYFIYIKAGYDILKNIFDQENNEQLWTDKSKLNKIKLILYYIIEYNNDDVKVYYERHGLIFLYFSYVIPSLIFYTDTKDKEEYKEYNTSQIIDYILKLSDEDIKSKSKKMITDYIGEYIKYIMSLGIDIRNISSNKNINKKIEYNKNGNSKIINMVSANNGSVKAVVQSTKPLNLHKTLLMEPVYFAT